MPRFRLTLIHQPACYHVICRITQGQLWLGAGEKIALCELLERLAPYCGVELLTFCVMSNHFHLLLRVPEKAVADAALDGIDLCRRVGLLHGEDSAAELESLWKSRANPGAKHQWEQEREMHLGRMHDLSIFMQLLKQRFTMSHNRHHGTRGTLWSERFKSVLVESREGARNPLHLVAAYIDLNPVRAGLVKDGADYFYSGVGRARLGVRLCRQGLMSLAGSSDWTKAKAWYRQFLGGNPAAADPAPHKNRSPRKSPQAHPAADELRKRQMALVKGLVVGSAAFVMGVLQGMSDLKRGFRPQAYASGGLGGDIWVGRKFHRT